LEQPTPEQLRRAADGSEAALEELVVEFYGPVLQYLHRFVGSREDAEDLSQEVFIRVARSLGGFDGRSRFSTWVFQIAKNAGIDFLRKRELDRRRRDEAEAELPPMEYDGTLALEDSELLWASIRALNEDLRAALLLRDLMGFRYQEIAEILDTTLSTVKWRIYEARERVQRRFRELGGQVGSTSTDKLEERALVAAERSRERGNERTVDRELPGL